MCNSVSPAFSWQHFKPETPYKEEGTSIKGDWIYINGVHEGEVAQFASLPKFNIEWTCKS